MWPGLTGCSRWCAEPSGAVRKRSHRRKKVAGRRRRRPARAGGALQEEWLRLFTIPVVDAAEVRHLLIALGREELLRALGAAAGLAMHDDGLLFIAACELLDFGEAALELSHGDVHGPVNVPPRVLLGRPDVEEHAPRSDQLAGERGVAIRKACLPARLRRGRGGRRLLGARRDERERGEDCGEEIGGTRVSLHSESVMEARGLFKGRALARSLAPAEEVARAGSRHRGRVSLSWRSSPEGQSHRSAGSWRHRASSIERESQCISPGTLIAGDVPPCALFYVASSSLPNGARAS